MRKTRIRNTEIRDWNQIENIHDGSFPFPKLTDKRYIIQKSLLRDGKVVGFCCSILTTETIMILDPDSSNIQKAKMIRDLHECVSNELVDKQLPETVMFVMKEDKSTTRILKKLGHEEVKGKPIVWQGKKRR